MPILKGENSPIIDVPYRLILFGFVQTESDGASIIGPEGSSAFLTFKADEGDDNADLFDIGVNNGGPFSIQNKASGSWETNLKCIGNGAVELYYDNSKKLETISTGVQILGDLQLQGNDGTANSVYWDKSDYILKFKDSTNAEWGDGRDLRIYHDGSHSYIKDAGTGQLRITSDSNIWIEHGAENMIVCNGDAAVELYYDNAKKLETLSDGVLITGQCRTTADFSVYDNVKFKAGSSSDLLIYHDATYNWIDSVNNHHMIIRAGTGNLYLQGNEIQFNVEGGSETYLKATNNGAVELYYDNSKKFQTYNGGVEVFGDCSLGDNRVLNVGTGSDLQIWHNGSASIIKNTTGDLQFMCCLLYTSPSPRDRG